MTSKVHAVVDANGLPVRLGLSPGEAHDNRLCSVLLAGLLPHVPLGCPMNQSIEPFEGKLAVRCPWTI